MQTGGIRFQSFVDNQDGKLVGGFRILPRTGAWIQVLASHGSLDAASALRSGNMLRERDSGFAAQRLKNPSFQSKRLLWVPVLQCMGIPASILSNYFL